MQLCCITIRDITLHHITEHQAYIRLHHITSHDETPVTYHHVTFSHTVSRYVKSCYIRLHYHSVFATRAKTKITNASVCEVAIVGFKLNFIVTTLRIISLVIKINYHCIQRWSKYQSRCLDLLHTEITLSIRKTQFITETESGTPSLLKLWRPDKIENYVCIGTLKKGSLYTCKLRTLRNICFGLIDNAL